MSQGWCVAIWARWACSYEVRPGHMEVRDRAEVSITERVGQDWVADSRFQRWNAAVV